MMQDSKTKPSINVTAFAPLIVSGTAATREYNYVVLDPGAYIRILDGAKFSAEVFTRTWPADFPESEKTVHQGGQYLPGDIYSGFDIIIAGPDGADGINGGDGGDGAIGGNGGSGSSGKDGLPLNQDFELTIKDLQFDASVYYGGGKGGYGGRGGNGGNSTDKSVSGGYGGNGGNGGDGGDQSDHTLSVNYSCITPSDKVEDIAPVPLPFNISVTNAKAPFGVFGQGGDGGAPSPSSGDNKGKNGVNGQRGKQGSVIINGKPMTAIKKPLSSIFRQGQTELDFKDTKQAEAYIDLFGGEEHVKVKYPLFYAAWLKSKTAARRDSGGADEVVPQGLALSAIDTVGAARQGEKDGDNRTLESTISLESVPPVSVIVQGTMTDETEQALIDTVTQFVSADDFDGLSIFKYMLKGNIKDIFANVGKEIKAVAACTYPTADGRLRANRKEQTQYLVGGSTAFAKIEISKPKGTHQTNQINFVYGRPGDSNTDYSVSDSDAHVVRNSDGSGKSTGVYLPVDGDITPGKDFTPVGYSVSSTTIQTQLQFGNEGIVYYGYTPGQIAGFFSILDGKINFSYTPYWGDSARIDCSRFGTNGTFMLNLSGYYTFNCKALGNVNCAFGIQSTTDTSVQYYVSTDSAVVYIPPIHIVWGCFGKNTLITMADGTQKPVTELKAGDLVKGEDGSAVEVLFAGTGGHEDKLVHMETVDGHAIDVTDTHPVKTDRGTIAAGDIHANDVVFVDGGTSTVKYAYLIDYDDEVCSVRLSGNKFCIGNGFITGDLDIQNGAQGSTKPELSDEVKALSDEIKLAYEELI